jgi:hypothetical protein
MDKLDYPFELYKNVNNNQRIYVKKHHIIVYGSRKIIYSNNNESK